MRGKTNGMIYLQWLRKSREMSQQQLAAKLGISRSTVAMWESGSSQPDNNSLFRLADIFNKPMELIICPVTEWEDEVYKYFEAANSDETKLIIFKNYGVPNDLAEYYCWLKNKKNTPKSSKIKVIGYVRAGEPIEAIEDVLGYEEIPEEMMKTGNYFGLVVKGDSMEPKFSEGDTVIVKQQSSAESGDVVVALIDGEEATIKRIELADDGIILQPMNPSYKAMYFSQKEVRERPVNIIGKVVELRARF